MDSPDVTVDIPMLLGNATRGAREIRVTGATLQDCLDDLVQQYPVLQSHLYECPGELRKHVLVLFNGQNTRWLDARETAARSGDRITILQAVSGG